MTPSDAFIFPSHARLRAVSGTLTDVHPSKATVRYRPKDTPGADGHATGPASTSNSAFTGAAPIRRRRSRSALADGARTTCPSRPAVSFSRTFW